MKTVDPATLKQWLDKDEAVLIDVREPGEYRTASIPGAILKPLGQLDMNDVKAYQGKKIVIHCQLGKRGQQGCEKLMSMQPDMDLYNLEGGLVAWQQANLPVHTSQSNLLPLNQQVQLTVGTFVLLGSVLSYFIHPVFTLLTAFFGAGLMFAGLTGNCAMARLLAKMPWNQ